MSHIVPRPTSEINSLKCKKNHIYFQTQWRENCIYNELGLYRFIAYFILLSTELCTSHIKSQCCVKVTDLFEKLKHGLMGRMQDSQWLDDESKAAALIKLRELRGHFFTWPHFWNDTYVQMMMDQAREHFHFALRARLINCLLHRLKYRTTFFGMSSAE